MYFSKFAKKVLAVAVAVAVTASSVVANQAQRKPMQQVIKLIFVCRQRSLHSEISMTMQSFQTNFRTRQTNCQKTV